MSLQDDRIPYVRVRNPELRVGWIDFVGAIPWEWFVTLTFDPKRVFPVGRERAGREATRWCQSLAWMYRRPVGWLISPERGRSGQWHAHALLIGLPRDISDAAAPWESRNGKINLRRSYRGLGATLYATKETGPSGEVLLSDTLHLYLPGKQGTTVGRSVRF